MTRWVHSLHFRIIVSFAFVLALALTAVGIFFRNAVEREVAAYQVEVEEARAQHVEQLISQYYANNQSLAGVQEELDSAASLYSWEIVVRDQSGNVVAETARQPVPTEPRRFPREMFRRGGRDRDPGLPPDAIRRLKPIANNLGNQIGSLTIEPSADPTAAIDPPISRLGTALNRSLVLTGALAGVTGVLLLSFVSQRMLGSVRHLTVAARRLGTGDLSQRVPAAGSDEVAVLGKTFNSMADTLQKAEKQRQKLMADLAHELGTPLSNIQGYVEAMKDGVMPNTDGALETIRQQVVHLTHLVEDVKFLAMVDAGAIRLNKESDSLGDVLRRAVSAFQAKAAAKSIVLSMDMLVSVPPVTMDRVRIGQVITNLLENAIRHTNPGGKIHVSAGTPSSRLASVSVTDTGEGIPPEAVPYIFDRFYRADSSRNRSTGGAGLGLTIVKKLVEAHGGTITVESKVGVGTTMTFTLPISG